MWRQCPFLFARVVVDSRTISGPSVKPSRTYSCEVCVWRCTAQSIGGSSEGPGGGHVPPAYTIGSCPCYNGSIGGSRGGPVGTCPLDHTGLCLCYVRSKSHFFLLTFTWRKFILQFCRFYDSSVCSSLHIGIFPVGWCLDRPILHFGGLTLSLSTRFASASNIDVVRVLLLCLSILLLQWS